MEQIPQFENNSKEEKIQSELPIESNLVQIALMKRWGEEQNIPQSDVAREWTESTLAGAFRHCAEAHEGELVDIDDESVLDELINEVLTRANSEALH